MRQLPAASARSASVSVTCTSFSACARSSAGHHRPHRRRRAKCRRRARRLLLRLRNLRARIRGWTRLQRRGQRGKRTQRHEFPSCGPHVSSLSAAAPTRLRLTGTRRFVIFKVARNQRIDMERRPAPFADAMRAVGIIHEVKRLAQFHKFVYQQLGSLVVHVVVARTVHHQQMARRAPRQS